MAVTTISLEPMARTHIDGALTLSRQAGWPHRREDWEFSLSVSKGIVGLGSGRVIATILMTPYGDDGATINLVIVDEAMRGRGLGRRLMTEALALAGERTCYLVATQDGLPLYEKLGFVATGRIIQHQGEALVVKTPDGVVWADELDYERLMALDRVAYGHDRSDLMQALCRLSKFAVLYDAGEIQSFAAIRDFGRGKVVGPVVARNADDARMLIDFLLLQSKGQFVRIDTNVDTGLGPWLSKRGLESVGGGITMCRPGQGQKIHIAGPYQTYALVSQALG